MKKKTSDAYIIDRKAQQLVEWKVIMSATWLMDALREYSENHPDDAIFDMDDYYNGWEERCPECNSRNITTDTEAYRKENPEWASQHKEDNCYICEDCGASFDEPYIPEIYEYWFVDDGFANLLRKKDEFVLDTCWVPIWGRRATGQAIYIDGVIQEIAKELLEKYGF